MNTTTFIVGPDLSIERRDAAPVEWLADLCSSLSDRLNVLSIAREIHTRELCEKASLRMLREISEAQPALEMLQRDARVTSWSGGNLIDLASARLVGVERRLAAINAIGIMSDAGNGGGVDPADYATLFKSIDAAYTPALRRVSDALAAAANKPSRLHATDPSGDEVSAVLDRLGVDWDAMRRCDWAPFVERHISPPDLRQAKHKRHWSTGKDTHNSTNLYRVRDVVREWFVRFQA